MAIRFERGPGVNPKQREKGGDVTAGGRGLTDGERFCEETTCQRC